MPPECADEKGSLNPQPRNKKKKWLRKKKQNPELILIIKDVENYCRSCVEWSEVKPILIMLEFLYLRDGPEELWIVIKRIRKEFMGRLYGNHIKTDKIVMNRPYIKGPLNSFKNNKRIDLSK